MAEGREQYNNSKINMLKNNILKHNQSIIQWRKNVNDYVNFNNFYAAYDTWIFRIESSVLAKKEREGERGREGERESDGWDGMGLRRFQDRKRGFLTFRLGTMERKSEWGGITYLQIYKNLRERKDEQQKKGKEGRGEKRQTLPGDFKRIWWEDQCCSVFCSVLEMFTDWQFDNAMNIIQ